MKLPRLLERDLKIVEKKKIWFLVPAVFVVLAIIFALLNAFVPNMPGSTGRAFNISIDFTGGYAMTLRLGDRLTDDTYDHYREEIARIAQELTPSDEHAPVQYQNQPFGLIVLQHEMMRQGEYENHAIYFRYRPLSTPSWFNGSNEEFMEYVNEQLVMALSRLFYFIPYNVALSNNVFTVSYDRAIAPERFAGAALNEISERLAYDENDVATGVVLGTVTPVIIEDTIRSVEVTVTGGANDAARQAAITHAFTLPDPYAGQAQHAGMTSPTIGTELLVSAILAVSLALVLMLIYVAFRFDLSSGASAVIGLVHDVIIMFSVMTIFHIEIGVTFIAALITILGYSLNNTIILFDRVRDKVKPYGSKEFNTKQIANSAARDTIFRSFATTTTGLFPMLALLIAGIIGVQSIVVFAIPIIVGLLAGTYSTLFILPSSWVGIKNLWFRRQKKKGRLPESGINDGDTPTLEPATT